MSARRWFVGEPRAGGPADTLGAILDRMGDPNAATEGRAFVDRIRSNDRETSLASGSVVSIWAARGQTSGDEAFEVLAVRSDLLAAQKPAALPTTADHRGSDSLVARVEAWLAERGAQKRREAHPVSRLDVGVSGVVLFALSHEARKNVEHAVEAKRLHKLYVGIARGKLVGEGTIEGSIVRSNRGARRGPQITEGGRPSTSRYRAIAHARDATLVELEPLTGRTHQLRLHLEARGAPLYGDRAHHGPVRIVAANGSVRELGRVMLHAHRVELVGDRDTFIAEAEIPTALRDLWSTLDGDPTAWNALEATSVEPS